MRIKLCSKEKLSQWTTVDISHATKKALNKLIEKGYTILDVSVNVSQQDGVSLDVKVKKDAR